MKLVLISLLTFFFFTTRYSISIRPVKLTKGFKTDSNLFKVYKIDSVNQFYIVYCKKEGRPYKIVSSKMSSKKGVLVKLNHSYRFELHSIIYLPNRRKEDLKLSQIDCINIAMNTTICLEGDSIRDIYASDNLEGLHFVKKYKYFSSVR